MHVHEHIDGTSFLFFAVSLYRMLRRYAQMLLYHSLSRKSHFGHPENLQTFTVKLQRTNTHIDFSTMSQDSDLNEAVDDDLSGLNDPDFPLQLDTDEVSSSGMGSNQKLVNPKIEDFYFLYGSVKDSGFGNSERCKSRSSDGHVYSSDAVLIAGMIEKDWGSEVLSFLRKFREKLNDSLVVDVLRLVKKPESCIKFFIWAGQQIGFHHTKSTYDALLESLLFSTQGSIPDSVLLEIKAEDDECFGKLLNVLVSRCCRNRCWNEALEELSRLKNFGYRPTKRTYIALIHVLLKAGQIDLAVGLYGEMSNAGFYMDSFMLGLFSYSLCKAGRWDDALKLIDKEQYAPDTVLSNKMIRGLCEAFKVNEAVAFLHRMRCSSCVPNSTTYETLIVGSLKCGQLNRCNRIVNQMLSEGCFPRMQVVNSFVHEFCKAGEYAYVYKMLKKMSDLGCRLGYTAYNIFLGAICGKEDLPSFEKFELVERVYGDMLAGGFVLNKINVEHLARCFCSLGKHEKAFTMIREMMSKGFIPDTSTYTKVIELLCQAKKVEKAFKMFEEMKVNKIAPDVFTYTILIDHFCKIGLIQQAQSWFLEMRKNGCLPNVVTYTSLIHAHLKVKRVHEAEKLFNSMLVDGCTPNVVTYTALIDGYFKSGDVDKACQIYESMKSTVTAENVDQYFGSLAAEANKQPNVFTYGALVDGLCKSDKVDEAHELLDVMLRAGCEPNHVVYDALIDGYCKAGKLEQAEKVFVKMAQHGYNPNVYTYSSLIDKLFKDKRVDLALKVLSKMVEKGCAPNVVTYTELIDGLCKSGKIDEALRLLKVMEEKGCRPNVVTYTAIIDGFGRSGEVRVCLDLLKQMIDKGCAPNLRTYQVLIKHCCDYGYLDEAHDLLDEMKQTHWSHGVGYGHAITGFTKEFIHSLGLLDEVSQYTKVPILPAYSIIIDSLNKAGRLQDALNLHREVLVLSASAHSPDWHRRMYSSLIESFCLACDVEKAFELYSDMTRRGFIPEFTVFVCLVKGLCRVNRWDDALQLSHCVYHMVHDARD